MRVVFAGFAQTLRLRPDLIICGHINLAPLSLLLSAICGTHAALLAYGIEVWEPSSFLRLTVRQFPRILSISRFTADLMVKWEVDRGRIRTVPNAVDGEVFRPMNIQRPKHGFSLLTVARLDASEAYKGIDSVISVVQGLAVLHPNIRYIVAGKGDDLVRLQELTKSTGVSERVEFLGFVPDDHLPALYNQADLFVMVSMREGFGFVFIEALACGLPVITGNRDGSVEAVLDGRVGFLVDPAKPDEIKEGVQRFLNGTMNPRLLNKRYLREEILASYGFDKFREQVRDVFLETVG